LKKTLLKTSVFFTFSSLSVFARPDFRIKNALGIHLIAKGKKIK